MTEQGLFLSFEGTEGCGKTTQMRLLVDRLRSEHYIVVENQEPGGTNIGKQIRSVLLDPQNGEMDGMAELLLMFASRAQAAAEIVRPALGRGAVVVSDRFTDSTLAYQGAARGISFETVRKAHTLALGTLIPDVTLCLMIGVEEGLERAHRRNRGTLGKAESRIDEQSLEFHRKVQAGYRQIASEEPNRFRLIDGSGTVAAVAAQVWAEVKPIIAKTGRKLLVAQ